MEERAAGLGGERDTVEGRDGFAAALRIAVGGLLVCFILQAFLHFRAAPHGGPVLLEWQRYFGLAVYYEMLGIWLVAAPFFLIWLAAYRRAFPARPAVLILWAQGGFSAFYIFLAQADHEVLRFLGIRLTPSFLATYARPETMTDGLFLDLLAADHGGAFLSLLLLVAAPLAYLWWAAGPIAARRRNHGRLPVWLALVLASVPLAAPANGWRQATSHFRLRKVEPVTIAIAMDLRHGLRDAARPADYPDLVREYRRAWLARSGDHGWRFPDPDRPYWRVPKTARLVPEAPPWNVIYLQLETLRGRDAGFLNPGRGRSPTPHLDRLAGAANAASWTRASSFGMPSINGLFASHCSVAPHSRRYITGFTHVGFACLPELLRRRGWRTEMFNAGDTDWDNSSPWLRSWYDRLWRYPEARGRDRVVFRAAARRLRVLGGSGRPFFATIVSATNHTPFVNPEPGLDLTGRSGARDRILNTTRYTDHVVGEFIASLRAEPWFDRTIIVVTGDHGFNMGEHGRPVGQLDLYRESLWVPLVLVASHPRLVPGRFDQPASLLDIAPTLADLLGLRLANPWQGHSLLAVADGFSLAFANGALRVHETGDWSAVTDPRDGRPRLFDARRDWLQGRDLAASRPALARALIARADRAQQLHDHLLQRGRIVPTP